MTTPPEPVEVECPGCGHWYTGWVQPSVNLDLEGWAPDDPETQRKLHAASTCTCPQCGYVVAWRMLVVGGGASHA